MFWRICTFFEYLVAWRAYGEFGIKLVEALRSTQPRQDYDGSNMNSPLLLSMSKLNDLVGPHAASEMMQALGQQAEESENASPEQSSTSSENLASRLAGGGHRHEARPSMPLPAPAKLPVPVSDENAGAMTMLALAPNYRVKGRTVSDEGGAAPLLPQAETLSDAMSEHRGHILLVSKAPQDADTTISNMTSDAARPVQDVLRRWQGRDTPTRRTSTCATPVQRYLQQPQQHDATSA